MIMENLTHIYEIIDNHRIVFNSNATDSDVLQLFETWQENDDRPEISVIDMSRCSIAELKQPEKFVSKFKSLIANSFENLVEFIAPNNLQKIGRGYFSGCEKLQFVRLCPTSNSMKEIGEEAFLNCDSLKKVILPESLIKIGNAAFKGCDSLEFVELPSNIEELGEDSFAGSEKIILLDLSRCMKIKDLKIRVSAKQVYLPACLETFEGTGKVEDLWVPPMLNRINYKSTIRTNIWCFSNRLKSLNQIESYCTLCVPHSLADRYLKIRDAEGRGAKIFDFGEDGHKTQDYFWI